MKGDVKSKPLYLADSLPLVSQPLLGSELLSLPDLTVRFASLYFGISSLRSLAFLLLQPWFYLRLLAYGLLGLFKAAYCQARPLSLFLDYNRI
jgi:hypothetical protein